MIRRLAAPILVLVALSSPAAARQWVVEAGCVPPGGCDCSEIQPCIELAAAGDTVLVRTGNYVAAGTRTIEGIAIEANVFLKDGVPLVGEGAAVIDAGDTGIGVVADHLTSGALQGFQVRDGNASGPGVAGHGGGMLCVASQLEIRGNVFAGNRAIRGGALACEAGASPNIAGNTFSGNEAAVDGGAIYGAGGTASIAQNVFESNRANEAGAIRYSGSGRIILNTFRGNGRIAGVPGEIALIDGPEPPGPEVEVSGNLFHDGTSGVFVTTAPATVVSNNTLIRGEVGIVCVNTGDAVTLRNNIIVSHSGAAIAWINGRLPAVLCNDVWGNGTGYEGLPDPKGANGNIALDPLHCDPAAGNFGLAENSPCAPANSGGCGQIGAFGVSCPPSAIEPASWGAIKAGFGRRAEPGGS